MSHNPKFLNMGQHGVTGWWPVIFAMLAAFCSYSGVLLRPIPGPNLMNNSTQVYFIYILSTSSTETDAYKGSTPENGQRLSPSANPKCLLHYNRLNLQTSCHIHLSGVTIDLLPGKIAALEIPDAHPTEPFDPRPLIAQPTVLALVGAGCPHKHP